MEMKNEENPEGTHSIKSKREEFMIEIRKKKCLDNLNAKRFKKSEALDKENDIIFEDHPLEQLAEFFDQQAKLFMIHFKNNDIPTLTQCIILIRKALSYTDIPPVKLLLDTKIIPFIAECLDDLYSQYDQLQYEATWILVNVGSIDEPYYSTYLAGECDVVKRLINLLKSPNKEIVNLAIWALGNLVAENIKIRDDAISKNVVDKVYDLFKLQNPPIDYYENYSRLVSNLISGKPYPDFPDIAGLLPVISDLLKSDNNIVLNNALWNIARIADMDEDECAKEILDMEIIPILQKVLLSEDPELVLPALRAIGNISSGPDTHSEVLMQSGIPTYLLTFLKSSKKNLRKETTWIFSNFLAGNNAEIISSILLIPGFLDLLRNILLGDEYEIAKEALFCFVNATAVLDEKVTQILVDQGFIEVLIKLLTTHQTEEILLKILDALENILDIGDDTYASETGVNPYLIRLEQCNGISILESIQAHESKPVYEKVLQISEKYFQGQNGMS